MEKIDFKKRLAPLYQASADGPVQLDVPALNFLMADGEGDPNTSPSYAEAVGALFGVAYAVKFMIKKGPLAIDYAVMPLEGLWWADDLSVFATKDKARWKWTMMILQPPFVGRETVDDAIAEVAKKKKPPAISRLRLETLTEGRCAQILHVGPFSAEGPTIEKLHGFIDANGEKAGKHHEIYLSDIRRAEPAKWRTIIRQPMR
ncbi:GyrI-like domain-containing protein [Methylococcus sp. ANG]|uniref:GyrI-like domain-containing protein n=1 Tax=unclassified Methylococcus TaxID=2618889 RepID=UPI001C533A17|nr:GyrI-like domain-containing protein [Methylococcus sp. Mc7]QXP83918.1 GyrI-like domain-containing protein [Methylococcus sp. Mc7]